MIAKPKKKGLFIVSIGVEELDNLYKGIEKKIGLPIDRLIIATKIAITFQFIEVEFPDAVRRMLRLLGRVIKRSKSLKNLMIKIALKRERGLLDFLGWGVVENIKMENSGISAELINPAILPLMIGGTSGSMQYIFGHPSAEANWEEKEGVAKISMKFLKKESKLAKYVHRPLTYSETNLLPGEADYHYCLKCGVSMEIAEFFRWEPEKASFYQKKTGKRYMSMSTFNFNDIFKMLEGELGKEIPKIIVDLEKEYIKKNFQDIKTEANLERGELKGEEEDYRALLNIISIKGFGIAVEIKKQGKDLKVRINNPGNEAYLAGIISGMYEAIEKTETQVQWLPSTEGYTIITVSPK